MGIVKGIIMTWLLLSGSATVLLLLFMQYAYYVFEDELEDHPLVAIYRDSISFLLEQTDTNPLGICYRGTPIDPSDENHNMMLEATFGWFRDYGLFSRERWQRIAARRIIKRRKYLLVIAAYPPGDMRGGWQGADRILYVHDAHGYEGWTFRIDIFSLHKKKAGDISICVFNKNGEYFGFG